MIETKLHTQNAILQPHTLTDALTGFWPEKEEKKNPTIHNL